MEGLARQMSGPLLGTQIDAVYHTSLVFGGIEYFFGMGVQTCYPGSTHHGRPMEILSLGKTDLPLEIILEYLESLKAIYTAESKSYDLFLHNCNNFSHDFAMFLVGKGLPDHITSLPQRVLNTPFGQMLKPQIDSAMRGITQAPVPRSSIAQPKATPSSTSNGTSRTPQTTNGFSTNHHVPPIGVVHNVTRLQELENLLASAMSTCAVIFFTSSTCAPCKIVYPAYDELAAEAGNKAVLIKVDLNQAYEIGAKYQVRATPTFMTFLKGVKENQWSGANEGPLRGNIRMLIQMAHPPHPHTNLTLPTLQRPHRKPITYSKVPPLDKLLAKLDPKSRTDPSITALKDFITTRTSSTTLANAPLPPLPTLSTFILSSLRTLPPSTLFPIIDLLRLALVDPRVSGYFAEEDHNTGLILAILSHVVSLGDDCPYTLRLVTVHLSCNLFSSPLYRPQLLSTPSLTSPLLNLLTSSLLDTAHVPSRAAAASLAYNITAFNHLQRLDGASDLLPEGAQVELAAALVEGIGREDNENENNNKESSKELIRGLILALGLLVYGVDQKGEVVDLLGVIGAREVVERKKGLFVGGEGEELVKEVAKVL
ncbi:hypothetical protein MMC24_003984 [Lignoscripta atroalba]|nr:hypothetical protein [Lignoscripta atroalba]